MATCKGCGKEIVYAVNPATGKAIPLDPGALVYRVWMDETNNMHARPANRIVTNDAAYWTSHFSTCPKADEFSGSKRKAAVDMNPTP